MLPRRLAGFLLLTTLVAGCATANAVDPAAADGTLNGLYAAGPDTAAGIEPYAAAEPYGGSDPDASSDLSRSADPYGGANLIGSAGPYSSASPGAMGPSPSPTPSLEPIYSLPEAEGLQIARSSSKTTGVWLWQKCTTTAVVENPTRGRLSGEVVITFTRAGAAVETVTEFVQDLEPGKTKAFTAKSTKRADDAEVVVDTEGK